MTYIIKKAVVYPKGEVSWLVPAYVSMSMNNSVFGSTKGITDLIEYISTYTNRIDVIVGDYLHRYNEMIFGGYDEDYSSKIARNKGAALVSNFMSAAVPFSNTFSYDFIYTREFLLRPDFESKFARFRDLQNSHPRFRELTEYTVDVFLRRQSQIKVPLEKARELCRSYLFEELAIFEMLAEDGKCINVYPGNQLPIIKEIVTGKLPGVSETLEKIQAVEIKFRPVADAQTSH